MIKNFHIHLYYNDTSVIVAKELAKQVQDKFSVKIGTFHEKNVGPHPRWSVQLSVDKDHFGEILSYVALNRKGLTVFSHPDTGHDLADHRDYAIWMGEILELNLELFSS